MYYDKIRHRHSQVLAATGLPPVEFDALLITFKRRTLKTVGELPDRNTKRLIHILQGCEDVLLDGTDRPIQRPVDRQSACYSGKKTHSMKNNLLCSVNLRIVWLSSTYEGHVHDKKICDAEPLLLPKGIRLWQDTSFTGHRPEGVEVCMPKKKPKGKELTTAEKQENRRISGIRIKVEHAIGGMKKCRIVKERFRCYKFGFEDMVILIACGLHNFKINHKMDHITI